MNWVAEIDKYRDKLINAVIITVALIFSYNIYKDNAVKIDFLKRKISEEVKKNDELEKISRMDSKINSYRNLLTEKEKGTVMSNISDIAKMTDIEVLSVKPSKQEAGEDYAKDFFEVVINAPDYNVLAKFINAVETYKSFYIVESVNVTSQSKNDKRSLTVSLQLSSVSAKSKLKK